jgi:hypothetical protein
MRRFVVAIFAAAVAGAAWGAAPSLGNWEDASDKDAMTDAVSTGAQVPAPEGKLFVGCHGGQVVVGFLTKQYLGQYDHRETAYRIDGDPAVTGSWVSNDHLAMLQGSAAIALARKIQAAKIVVLRTFTFDDEPITATFDVAGAEDAVPHGLGPCASQ